MQQPDQLAPTQGEQVYGYSSASLWSNGPYSVFFGLLFSGVSLWMLVGVTNDYHTHPERVHGSIYSFWLGLSVFFLIGVAIIVYGLRAILSIFKEKLVLLPDEFVWFDYLGREKVRSSYSSIRHVSETTMTQASSSESAPLHHKTIIDTTSGSFTISDNIREYGKLRDYFIGLTPPSSDGGTYRYRNAVIWLVSVVFVPMACTMAYLATSSWIRGDIMEVNGKPEVTPFYVPLFVVPICLFFIVVLGYASLSSLFECIEIRSGQLRYVNWLGKLVVNVPLEHIESDSFQESTTAIGRGMKVYRVQTTQGVVKWSEQISGCSELVRSLKMASQQSKVGTASHQ